MVVFAGLFFTLGDNVLIQIDQISLNLISSEKTTLDRTVSRALEHGLLHGELPDDRLNLQLMRLPDPFQNLSFVGLDVVCYDWVVDHHPRSKETAFLY